MIAILQGIVCEYEGSSVIVDCNGVGYGVQVCVDEQSQMQLGKPAKLYIAEQIKEDTHELFGFTKKSRRELFYLLLSVSGVGPKASMAILNTGSEPQLRASIANGDVKFISSAQGVGKKVAERVVVDLKSKVGLGDNKAAVDFLSESAVQDEAVEALVALGYGVQDAIRLLVKIDSTLPTAERVTRALKERA